LAFLDHSCSVGGAQPVFSATEATVAHHDGRSSRRQHLPSRGNR
jgi:hypothetical protein